MKVVLLFFVLLVFKLDSFSQKDSNVLYNKKTNIIGITETILIPDTNLYYLKRIYSGEFPSITVDTLYENKDFFIGKLFSVSISEKRFVLTHREKKWKERLKYIEYDHNDPFILELKPRSK